MPSAGHHSVFSLAPYHIISYASVTGTTFFHSFINGIVMFRVLERPQFSAVQAKLFPVYFSMQTALPVALALTYPGGPEESSQSSVMGLLQVENGWSVLAPLGIMLVSSALNLALLRPVTDVMLRRREQGMYFYLPSPFLFSRLISFYFMHCHFPIPFSLFQLVWLCCIVSGHWFQDM